MRRLWKHDVSEAWLDARRKVLTATDISRLVPELKRCAKNPGKLSPGFAAVWCEKHSETALDTSSVGPAARGHLMEPWAVRAWNDNVAAGERFNHWDDCIIVNDLVGFSPDAMEYAQLSDHASLRVSPDGKRMENGVFKYETPKRIMEVKCYEPREHMKSILAGKMERKELMQLAVAFRVLPRLEKAVLLFCCPDSPMELYSEDYTRDDLKAQLDLVDKVVEKYVETSIECVKLVPKSMSAGFSEEDVYQDMVEGQAGGLYSFG